MCSSDLDNWKEGPEAAIRANVIEVLEKNGGELIEVPYKIGRASCRERV